MKKILIIICLLVIFSVNGFALIEKYDGKVYNGGEIVIDNQKFNFKISESTKRIVVTNNAQTMIIGDNICENSLKFKICAYNITVGFDDQDEADIKIYYYAPNLTIVRTQDHNEVEIGDSIEFYMELMNSGDFIATDIEYIDYFPEDILVEKIDGDCLIKDNAIEYNGKLKRNEKVKCSYKITLKKVTDLKLRAEINYFDGNEEKKDYSEIVQIVSKPIFSIKTYVYKNIDENTIKYTQLEYATLNIGEKVRLMINLSNLIQDELEFNNFTIIFPKGFEIISSNLKKSGDNYIFEGKISNNSFKDFYFVIIPRISDEVKIMFSSDLKKGEKEIKDIDNIIDFSINSNEIELSSSLDDLNNFDSGREISVSFYAKNTNLYNDLTIINSNITSQIFPNIYLPKMTVKKNSTLIIYKTSFIPKNDLGNYNFKLETQYLVQEDKIKSLRKEWTANVQKISEIELTKSYTSTKITEDEEAEITVFVRNTRNLPIYNVAVNEIFKTDFSYNGKTRSNIEMIKPDEKIEVYKYKLKAPKAKNDTVIEIYTNLSYYEDIYTQNKINSNLSINILKSVNITVEPRKPDLSITKSSSRTKLFVGDFQDVKYVLKNNDKKTIYDINVYFSESIDVDIVGKDNYYIKKMDPLEEISFINEKIMPKKEGNINAGKTVITLFDDGNNFFNYTIDSLSFEVINSSETMPLIFISKVSNTTSIFEDNFVNITVYVENKGSVGSDVKLVDNFEQFNIYSPQNSNISFSYLKKMKINEGYDSKIAAYYLFNSNQLKSFGKGQEIEIKKNNLENGEMPVSGISSNKDDKLVTEDQIKTESFIQKIIKKINSLFGIG